MGIVYKITNKINGKIYIGQTRMSLNKRWYYHLYSSKKKNDCVFSRAINKYGKNSFDIEILEIVELAVLTEKEQFYMQKFNSLLPNGYNTLPAFRSYDYPLEHIEKLKKAQAKRMQNPLDGENRSKAQKKSFQENPERRLKCKETYETGLKVWRENNPAPALGKPSWNKGLKTSEEDKAKLRKPKTKTDKFLAYQDRKSEMMTINNPFKGKKHTDETKALISKLQEKKRIGITCLTTGQEFSSIREASLMLNVSAGNISLCIKGARKSASGYTFKKTKEV
jgi:group I intron endonuclease